MLKGIGSTPGTITFFFVIVMTTLIKPCNKVVTVSITWLLQPCVSPVTWLQHGCEDHGCGNLVATLLQGCFFRMGYVEAFFKLST